MGHLTVGSSPFIAASEQHRWHWYTSYVHCFLTAAWDNGKSRAIKDGGLGIALAVQWLGLHASTAESPGSIPGQGTRMPQTAGSKGKKKKNVAWAIRLSSQENHWISHLGIPGACLAMPSKTKSPVNGCCRNEWINDLTSGQVGAWPQVAPVVKNPPVSAGFHSWVKKIPWRKAWQPTPVFLPDKSHEQRSLEGYSPWDHKELDQLSMHTCWASCPICKQE